MLTTINSVLLILKISLFMSNIDCYSNLEMLEKQQLGEKQYEGHKIVRAFPTTTSDINFINSLEEDPDIEVDFWSRSRNIDIHVSPKDYLKLHNYFQNANIKYGIINNNLQKSFEEEEKGYYRHSHGWHDNYHDYDQIIQKLNNLNSLQADRTTLLSIGKSYEGRDIQGLEIAAVKGDDNKQKVLIVCGQHAREWISPSTCIYIMEKMIMKYKQDAKLTEMLNRFNWVFFPVLNPDGYVYTWKKERLWRKNRQPSSKSSCHGIDLNRNWGYKFGESGSSNNPCSEIYRGEFAFSAPEAKAMANYMKRFKNKIFGFMDIHSYSQLIMFPWSYSKDVKAEDDFELHVISEKAATALRSLYGTNFTTGAAAVIIYEAAGSGKDWAYGSLGIKYSFVFELRDTGTHGFLLPRKEIIPTAEETLAALHSLSANMMDYEDKITSYTSE